MRNAIAVMNTKGGVGKSTLVLALAETLAALHGKTVLVIDSDSQASVSSMLMSTQDLYKLQHNGGTIVDLLIASVLQDQGLDWPRFVVPKVSDVDDARTVFLIPSDMQLTLFEREVSREALHGKLRSVIGSLLTHVRPLFDVVLIDCPPGLSVLTESWLREADFHISPTKADYVSTCGLEVFRRFKALNPEMGFAENLGVAITLRDMLSPNEEEYQRWLASTPDNRCFQNAIPRMAALQDAARFRGDDRSYTSKYPGDAGRAIRGLTQEVLTRMAQANVEAQAQADARAKAQAEAQALADAQARAQTAARVEAAAAAPVPPIPAQAVVQPPVMAPSGAAAQPAAAQQTAASPVLDPVTAALRAANATSG